MEENSKTYFGEVIWFSAPKGFGFISWSIDDVKQKDMFVHFTAINSDSFKTLKKGQRVSFQIGKNNNGVDKAVNVSVCTVQ